MAQARVTKIMKLANGDTVIFDEGNSKDLMYDPLYIFTEDQTITDEKGDLKTQAIIGFSNYLAYSDVTVIDRPSQENILAIYEPAGEIVEARDRFLKRYREMRQQQMEERQANQAQKLH